MPGEAGGELLAPPNDENLSSPMLIVGVAA